MIAFMWHFPWEVNELSGRRHETSEVYQTYPTYFCHVLCVIETMNSPYVIANKTMF